MTKFRVDIFLFFVLFAPQIYFAYFREKKQKKKKDMDLCLVVFIREIQ